jgi:hypothetical protein
MHTLTWCGYQGCTHKEYSGCNSAEPVQSSKTGLKSKPGLRLDFMAYWHLHDPECKSIPPIDIIQICYPGGSRCPNNFSNPAKRACLEKSFLTTSLGYIGLSPLEAQPGDIIYLLFDGKALYVLRPNVVCYSKVSGIECSSQIYRFIGECYVHRRIDSITIQSLLQYYIPVEMFDLR